MPGLKRSRAEETPESSSATRFSKDKKTKKSDDVVKTRKHDEAVKPKTSMLAAQEVDFPRGGGSGLTPLEFREAKREARVESAASELLFKDAKDEQAEAKRKKTKQKFNREKRNDAKKKRTAIPGAPLTHDSSEKREHIRVEHVNYKRLVPGSRLLCSVLAVHPVAVVVSLPNQMLGHIPATQISPQFTQRLQMAADAAAEEDDDESESSSDEDEDDAEREPQNDPKAVPELNQLFHVGQWLSATVLQVRSGDVAKGKSSREGGEYEKESRRVELTLAPHVTNTGVSILDLDVGSTLSTTIASLEDHGYMLDSGLPEFKGFVSYKDAAKLASELQAGKHGKGLQVGRVVQVKITKIPENRRSFEASLDSKVVSTSVIKHVPAITAILPGTLTKVLVTAALPSGLNVKLFGMFDATIDRFHLPEIPEDKEIADVYKEGSKHVARVLWDLLAPTSTALQGDNPDSERKLGLSLAPHILSLRPPVAASGELLQLKYPIGAAVQVTVVQTINDWGLVTLIKDTDLQGFVHISQVSDDHVVALPPNMGAYRKGTKHAARVIGHSPTDRVLQLSLKTSTLDKKFLRVSEVEVGQVLTANIIKLGLPNSIFLQLNGNVDGIVFANHFADIKLTQPEKRFKPGLQVKARVMDVDPSKNRIVLTCKKSLVRSELPIVASIQDARVGVVTHATVFRVLVNSIIVTLFGGLKALIPGREVSESNFDEVKSGYTEGKVVKMRITEVDQENERIAGSIKQSSAEYLAKLNVDAVEIGQKVSATVAAVHKEVVVLTLVPSGVRALISLSTLASMRKTTPEALQNALDEDEAVEDLVVSAKNPEKGIVICSDRLRNASDRTKDASASGKAETIREGSVVTGRVIQQNPKYLDCIVALGSATRATLSIVDLTDNFNVETKLPPVGSTTDCFVLSMKSNGKQAVVSTRASRVSPNTAAQIKDPEVHSVKDLAKGQKIRGYVKAITNVGLFVTIGRKVDARVQVREMFDNFVKDWKTKFVVGQVVSGTVMDVNVHQNEVEMSLKSKPGSIPTKKTQEDGTGLKREGPKRIWDFKAGDKVKGFVKNIVDFGLFVQIEGTTVSGLCHMKELSEGKPEEALKAFHVGDKVRAIVLKINEEKKTISFGLKPSYFDAADFEDSDSSDDASEDDDDVASDDDEEDEDHDDDTGDDESDDAQDFVEMDEDSDEHDSTDVDATESLKSIPSQKKSAPVLALSGGFSWSAGAGDGSDDDSSVSTSDSEDETDAEIAAPTKANKKTKTSKKSNLEEDLTADLATKAPSSATDFERLLLSSPNSSFLWIQFMSFALQLSDVDQAREVAKRALKVISYREDQERMNVWIALLNLENTYGSEESLEATFKEAVLANDGFTMYLKLVDIMEQSSKLDQAEELFVKAKAKYSTQPDYWIEFGRFYLRTGQADKARQLLPRAMQALPKREHVLLITSMAISEFKLGDAERGRTIFEGLVDSYPKRLDLWFQYIDQESRLSDNHSHTRNLFDRALTLKLTAKKGKSLLKKWLEYEKRHGDAKSQSIVLKKAKEFVEEMNAKNQEVDEDDDVDDDN